jgi:hypothetical protein
MYNHRPYVPDQFKDLHSFFKNLFFVRQPKIRFSKSSSQEAGTSFSENLENDIEKGQGQPRAPVSNASNLVTTLFVLGCFAISITVILSGMDKKIAMPQACGVLKVQVGP